MFHTAAQPHAGEGVLLNRTNYGQPTPLFVSSKPSGFPTQRKQIRLHASSRGAGQGGGRIGARHARRTEFPANQASEPNEPTRGGRANREPDIPCAGTACALGCRSPASKHVSFFYLLTKSPYTLDRRTILSFSFPSPPGRVYAKSVRILHG